MSSIREMLGDTGGKAVEAMLVAGASRPAAGILATILDIGALLFAAIGVVVQLKDANVVWEVEESEESGLWHFGPAITCCRSPRFWRSASLYWSPAICVDIGKQGLESTYGAAASTVVVLI
jgi:hypothetical protein